MKVLGFDNHMFPGAAIAVGRRAAAGSEEVALCNGSRSLVVTKKDALVDGRPASNDEIISTMKEIFGDAPEAFELRSPGGSVVVYSSGTVVVNGQVVGQSPEMLSRVLSFVVETVCPQTESWIREVIEELRDPCCGNAGAGGKKSAKYCAYCGREVSGG